MADAGLLIYLTVIAVFVAVTVVARRVRSQGNFGRLSPDGSAHRTSRGLKFEYEHFEGTSKRPAYLKVRIAGFPRAWFRIVREGEVDRAAKGIGLSREIQSGDAKFDRDFYMEAEPHDLPTAFFADEMRRGAVRKIMKLGFSSIENSDDILVAEWLDFELEKKTLSSLVQEAAEGLHSFSGNVAQVYPGQFRERSRWSKGTRNAIAVTVIFAAVITPVAMLVAYKPLDEWSVFFWSLKYSVPALLGFLFLVTSYVRGRSTAHRDLLAIAGAAIIVFPSLGMGTAVLLNGKLDTSPAVPHDMRVLDKREHHSRRSHSYNLIVDSWRPGHPQEKIRVSRAAFETVVTMRSMLTVVTRAGRFGFEYRTGYTIQR